jgi:hypothetical protein
MEYLIAGVVVTADNCSPSTTRVINLSPVSTTQAINENPCQGLTTEQLIAGVVDTADSFMNISANF